MKNVEKYIALLPVAFALHNVEEAIYINNVNHLEFNHFLYNQTQFIIAVSLFTTLGFVLVFGKKLYKSESAYQYATVGFAGMLFLNAIISHIIPSIFFLEYMPGVVTAVLLLLPLTTCILWKNYKLRLFSNKQLIITIFSGGIIGIILVGVFLGIAHLFVK
jgi:hypothetical protein